MMGTWGAHGEETLVIFSHEWQAYKKEFGKRMWQGNSPSEE